MKVALIGSKGQLGQDVAVVFSKDKSIEVLELYRPEFDVTEEASVEKLVKERPDLVINAAAYHKVDDIEDNSEEAFLVNASSQKKLSEMCGEKDIPIVYISTDYVYGLNEKDKGFVETDEVGPVNTYGISKAAGEMATRFTNEKHYIVRVSGLFGKVGASGKGGNFVELMMRLGKEKGKVRVVDDQVLTPTYTKNVAENLLELVKTKKYGTYHMTSEGQCSWYEFAKEIFRLTKMDVECTAVSSEEFPTRAIRPEYSVLENKKLKDLGVNKMNNWKTNLKLYLEEKGYI